MTARLALLGCGWVADMHARAAATCGHTVAGVANHRLESAERFASEHSIERVTTDWRALVRAPDVDVVVVCTPNALHAEQSIAALEAGKHVFCEKPMATTVADAEAMLAAAARHDRLLLVLHPWRHHERRDRACATRSLAGELGASCARTATACTPTGARAAGSPIPALAGGGALVDMGIHAIDTARFLLGEPEPQRVLRVDPHRARQLRGRRRRHRPDRVGGRRALGRGVGLVAAAPRRLRGRHRGLRQHGLPAHLGARAAARLRALRRRPLHRAAARRHGAGRGLAARDALAARTASPPCASASWPTRLPEDVSSHAG